MPPSRLKLGSAHHLVGQFPRSYISPPIWPTNRGGAYRVSAFFVVGNCPIYLPTYEVGRFVVDGHRRAWFALWDGSCASQAAPKRGARRSERNVEASSP